MLSLYLAHVLHTGYSISYLIRHAQFVCGNPIRSACSRDRLYTLANIIVFIQTTLVLVSQCYTVFSLIENLIIIIIILFLALQSLSMQLRCITIVIVSTCYFTPSQNYDSGSAVFVRGEQSRPSHYIVHRNTLRILVESKSVVLLAAGLVQNSEMSHSLRLLTTINGMGSTTLVEHAVHSSQLCISCIVRYRQSL